MARGFDAAARGLAWALALGLFGGVCDSVRAASVPPAGDSRPAVVSSLPANSSLGDLPRQGGVTGYASSASCGECHADEVATWKASFHRSMTQRVGTNSVVADFNGVSLETESERFTLSRNGDRYSVAIEDLDEIRSWKPGSPRPESVHVPVQLVTGSHHMQVFWLPAGAGNAQIGFPFTWLIPEGRWIPRESAFIREPHAARPVETWNMTCIRCHATAGQPRPRREQAVFDTRVAELGISCEACHGPADDHVRLRRARAATLPAAERGQAGQGSVPPHRVPAESPALAGSSDPVVQPGRLDHVRSSHVCGQCHGMKWFDSSEGWVEDGFRYRPGDDLEATTPIIRPGRATEQPWMKQVLERAPGLFTEFFWSDGMIRVAGREYNGLLETACYQKGQLSCLSCHALHKYADRNDQLKPGMDGNKACVSCHDEARYGSGHTHHEKASSGSVCYNCHMPHTTYALLGGIRQHKIDSPRVAASLATGRPNACNICHLDRTLAWTAERLTKWYGHPASTLPTESDSVSEVSRLLLSGDAGQRALAAWYLGWEPARRVAGDTWQAPLLGRTLSDPYPAVRIVAWRSLRQLPGFADLAFDHAGAAAPDAGSAMAEVGRRWGRARTASWDAVERKARLLTESGESDTTAIERWAGRRNDRPMRLRE